MLERILMAGSGGQGIVYLGRLLARAAIDTIPYVTFFPSYGAEVRGGTSNCQVILSSAEIASPVAETVDALIIMNQPSVERFLPYLTKAGLAIINRSLCNAIHDKRLVFVRATEIADRLGNPMAANVLMLGALLARKPLVAPSDIEQFIARSLPAGKQDLLAINLKAFQAGLKS